MWCTRKFLLTDWKSTKLPRSAVPVSDVHCSATSAVHPAVIKRFSNRAALPQGTITVFCDGKWAEMRKLPPLCLAKLHEMQSTIQYLLQGR